MKIVINVFQKHSETPIPKGTREREEEAVLSEVIMDIEGDNSVQKIFTSAALKEKLPIYAADMKAVNPKTKKENLFQLIVAHIETESRDE